jgi:hypothetical protein
MVNSGSPYFPKATAEFVTAIDDANRPEAARHHAWFERLKLGLSGLTRLRLNGVQ